MNATTHVAAPRESAGTYPHTISPRFYEARLRGCRARLRLVAIALLAGVSIFTASAADIPTELPPSAIPKVPVPKSPYIGVVYRYADTMLAKGRDTFGPQKTGLFLSAIDRTKLELLMTLPGAPGHMAYRDALHGGPLFAANAQHDENLLRLLYTLSELSGKPAYRDAADAALKWLIQNNKSPFHAWDVVLDDPFPTNVFFRPWLLWDRCFDLAEEPSRKFAEGLQDSASLEHIGLLPREGGFALRMLAVGYARTKNERVLEMINTILERLEASRPSAQKIDDGSVAKGTGFARLSLTIDIAGAAHRVPEPLAARMRAFAEREDAAFSKVPHDLQTKGGFLGLGEPPATPLWKSRPVMLGQYTTAQVGMMCVSRYENSGHTGMRDLMHAAADAYLKSNPADADDVWPGTLGQVISLQLAAWRSTSKQVYFDRARQLGDFALEKFFGDNPLPRASLKKDHYESITGADSLVLALLELHLSVLHITAVRCPSNTIDR